MSKTIHAYTEPDCTFPAYVNISESGSNLFSITVRSLGNEGRDTGTIYLSRQQLMDLVNDASEHLDADPQANKDAAAKSLAAAVPHRIDNPGLRAHALELALRWPDLIHRDTDAVSIAKTYVAYLQGE